MEFKYWKKILFVILGLIIFFIYYRQELIHNLDHLPLFLQELIKRIFLIK